MNLGDIFWVELPNLGGREQRGRRPAIIWQDTQAFGKLPTVLVIPLTSSLSALRFPATLSIKRTRSNGLAADSAALVFQLGAADVRRFRQRLGQLDKGDLQAVRRLAKQLQGLG